MNINIYADLSVEREPVIGQTLIDMRGRKSAWEGIQLVILILVVELNDIVKGQIIVSYTKKAWLERVDRNAKCIVIYLVLY